MGEPASQRPAPFEDVRAVRSAAAVAALLAVSSNASAFCRTSTEGLRDKCAVTPDECCTVGKPLYWEGACVGYSMQRSASTKISLESATYLVSRAFTTWTGTSCPADNSATSRVSIDVRDLGPVVCGSVELNAEGPNQNTIVFRDDFWNHNDADNVLGLTTVQFDKGSGRISGADMEINTNRDRKMWDRENEPMPEGYDDFLSVVTHEAGHFLGMAHSGDRQATMFAKYDPGSFGLRNLKVDDVRGICSIYKPDGDRVGDQGKLIKPSACDPTPPGGQTSECKENEGCSVAPAPGGSGVVAVLALSMVAMIRGLRRRR
jgi:MYXO-CTERM domain-containing protein